MSVVKSGLINKLSNNYPNFIKKDLSKVVEIILDEIKESLKRGERVEIRDVFTLEVKKVKAKYARNPRTNEKIYISEKKKIKFKFSKVWSEKINEKI